MLSSSTVSILGVGISRLGLARAIEHCSGRVRRGEGGYVCFVNVHSVTESDSVPALKNCLNLATFAFADGMPLVWVSRWMKEPVESRVCGPDFMSEFVGQNRDLLHGFIGGRPGQAEVIARRAGVKGVFYSPPMRPFSIEHAREDWEQFLKLCSNGKTPSIIWVGLGAPKQEFWMQEVSRVAPHTLFMGVGAAFDFLAGTKTRAPIWMQRSGLEWVYRLLQEPSRLWKRYFTTNSRFLFAILKEYRANR